MKELLLDVDNFNTPKVLNHVDGEAEQLLNMLVGRKDVRVTPGVAFEVRRYRFKELKESISSIENDFREHCNKYLPGIYIDSLHVRARTEESLLMVMTIIEKETNAARNIIFNIEDKKTSLLIKLIQN